MTGEQMKEYTLDDLFRRQRGGDNEAARVLLEHFSREDQIKSANEYATREASKLIAEMTGKNQRIGGGETTEEYAARLKSLGLED